MEIIENIHNLIIKLLDLLPPITVSGVVEIVIFTFLIFHIIKWIAYTKAYNLLRGIFIIGAFVLFSYVFQLRVIFEILKNISSVVIILLVIVFQNDIRKAIEGLGRYRWINKIFDLARNRKIKSDKEVSDICRSVFEMSKDKVGALIVIQQTDDLSNIIDTGIKIDGYISSQLLIQIFVKNTPLHDGAVVIVDNKIVAATCYLPMSDNLSISKDLGTRHRAGLGMSEVSDAYTIIVSEETGNVRGAFRGELTDKLDENKLHDELYKTVYKTETQEDNNNIASIMKGWFSKNESNK